MSVSAFDVARVVYKAKMTKPKKMQLYAAAVAYEMHWRAGLATPPDILEMLGNPPDTWDASQGWWGRRKRAKEMDRLESLPNFYQLVREDA